MEPRGSGRFCDKCQHTVIDLDGMSRAQVDARLSRARGDYACIRLPVDAAGEPLFRRGPNRARHAAGGLVLVSALTAGGCAIADDAEPPVITAIEEAPCDLPPMLPVETGAVAAEGPVTGPVDAALEEDSGVPSPDQRRLTADKHRPPPVRHVMGRMPIRRPTF